MDKDDLELVLATFIDFFELLKDKSKVTVQFVVDPEGLERFFEAKRQVEKARALLAEVKKCDNILFS